MLDYEETKWVCCEHVQVLRDVSSVKEDAKLKDREVDEKERHNNAAWESGGILHQEPGDSSELFCGGG